jgi:hypothetical protein
MELNFPTKEANILRTSMAEYICVVIKSTYTDFSELLPELFLYYYKAKMKKNCVIIQSIYTDFSELLPTNLGLGNRETDPACSR